MTDTIGKIEQLSQGLTVHIKTIEAEFCKKYVERVAKWQCIQHDEDPIAADGSEQWKNYIPLAREILGIN